MQPQRTRHSTSLEMGILILRGHWRHCRDMTHPNLIDILKITKILRNVNTKQISRHPLQHQHLYHHLLLHRHRIEAEMSMNQGIPNGQKIYVTEEES
jgi:hypothetical protein